jgi:ribosomal protein L31
MEGRYCNFCKKWIDDWEENTCAACGEEKLEKEVVELEICSECHNMFPKEEGTEYNHRKTGIDEVDCDVRCEDCESARETRESYEKSYRLACFPRRR